VAGVPSRCNTPCTSANHVTLARVAHATEPRRCPWHPRGGCGFCRHGTYPRVHPPGTLIARWRCPTVRRTLSALPDWLAAWRCGTLARLEATVLDVERAGSIAAAANTLRTDIQLPGALRQLGGLTRAVHAALRGVRGLEPERLGLCAPTLAGFAVALGIVPDADTSAAGSVLVALRSVAAAHLHRLPAPLVFDPCRVRAGRRRSGFQHEVRADRPDDVVEPRDPATASAPVRPPRGSSPSMNDTEQDLIERIAVFRRGRPGGAAQAGPPRRGRPGTRWSRVSPRATWTRPHDARRASASSPNSTPSRTACARAWPPRPCATGCAPTEAAASTS